MIKRKVEKLIEKFNTRNPFLLAKKLGIEVIVTDLEDVRGFYKKILRKKVIFINSEMTDFEKDIVCGHELGHAILHSTRQFQFMLDNTNILKRNRLEDEANLFMRCLVLDDENKECCKIEELKKLDYRIFEDLKRL